MLSERAEVLYKCDQAYNRESEAGIIYNDSELNIDWQIPIEKAIVSEKDKNLPALAKCNNNFEFKT